MQYAKRLKTKPNLAKCPNCGGRHRIRHGKIVDTIFCTKLARRRGSSSGRSSEGIYRVYGDV
jgi:hypothetical protein